MWAQRKFSLAMRAGLSIAIPALSAVALAGILLLPRGASPAKLAPAVVGETSAAVAATGSAPTTGSQRLFHDLDDDDLEQAGRHEEERRHHHARAYDRSARHTQPAHPPTRPGRHASR